MLHLRPLFPNTFYRQFLRASGAALCLSLAACASSPQQQKGDPTQCRDGESWQVQEHLYFGTHTPQGFVSKTEWATFVETAISPKFPHGLTVLAGSGQWQGASGNIVREPSYVLSLIYPYSQEKDAAIAEIIREYKRAFQQQAVLRVRSGACVSFP